MLAQKPNEENKFVFEGEKLEAFIQLDEINGIEKSGKFKDDYFYKPYLTNVVLLKDITYLNAPDSRQFKSFQTTKRCFQKS